MFRRFVWFVMGLFPIKARSLDDFIRLVRENRCAWIEAQQESVLLGTAHSEAVGTIGQHSYLLRVRAKSSRHGRWLLFTKMLIERFGSEYGKDDAKQREEDVANSILIAEEEATRLEAGLPGVEIRRFWSIVGVEENENEYQ